MPYISQYTPETFSRDDVDQSQGPMVIEFGTSWCGFCKDAQVYIKTAMNSHSEVRHVKVEDGKGRVLGRTYGVKLWPALIFLKDGKEFARLVRPGNRSDIEDALRQIH
jgi:thioredoxin 1